MKTTKFYLLVVKGTTFKLGFRGTLLTKAEIPDHVSLTSKQNNWFWNNVPIDIVQLGNAAKRDDVDISPLNTEPIPFDDFWNKYSHKVGNKSRAQRLWNAMSDIDRLLCMNAIPQYRFWLNAQTGINCLYPETFLSQRRWENDFKV